MRQDCEMRAGDEKVARAVAAAELLFNERSGAEVQEYFEPDDRTSARAAVARLAELFDALPGRISEALGRAADHADSLSADRLQGLSEIVQNADDVGASEVRFLLRPDELLVAHDGSPVELRHVIGLSTPWLTTKEGEESSTGRFGIGLMTLRSLAPSLEVHCEPYHFRIGAPTLTPIGALTVPPKLASEGWTVMRVPLERGVLSAGELKAWFDRWDDAALLFLRHVRRIERLDGRGAKVQELGLKWTEEENTRRRVGAADVQVLRRHAKAPDGRTWLVLAADLPSPANARRARKAAGEKTPVGVALPLRPGDRGALYAGLPMMATDLRLRAHAQFDPLTNRQGLADTAWNRGVVELVADLWTVAVLDLFARSPKTAWSAVPVEPAEAAGNDFDIASVLGDLLLERARSQVAALLAFTTGGGDHTPVTDLAVESVELESVLTSPEVAGLAGLDAALPVEVRDSGGTWRQVLSDWRTARGDLSHEVEVLDALPLLDDAGRDVRATIDLAAAAIEAGLGSQLPGHACLTTYDHGRIPPPGPSSPVVLTAGPSPLAEQLGLAVRLHPAHTEANDRAEILLEWLRGRDSLLDGDDLLGVLGRVAAAGRAGHQMSEPLTDEQAVALRAAFERLDSSERIQLGPGVGRAVLLHGYVWEGDEQLPLEVSPTEAYLPKRIDREPLSFADAAARTPGVVWVDDRYAELLRSPAGRAGLGAQRFLKLLGAETAPRIRRHPRSMKRFADRRTGVAAWVTRGPRERQAELELLGATYSLDDHDSPDLDEVARDIAGESKSANRRKRARALIASVSRGWDRLGDDAVVTAAHDQYSWQHRGEIPAFWLWQVRSHAWLDNSRGEACRPVGLRVKTKATEAVYGPDVDYLHPDLDAPGHRTVLSALGVTGEPTALELINRLTALRADGDTTDTSAETAVVYRALAGRVADMELGQADLSTAELRRAFGRAPGLIFTDGSWLPPLRVRSGPPIFGSRRPFVPSVSLTEPLWAALRVPTPDAADCLSVLREIARDDELDPIDEAVMLESFRLLQSLLADVRSDASMARRLAKLPLWTSKGWKRDRPVFSVADPVLADGLIDTVPVWWPGGESEQFKELVPLLTVTEITAHDISVLRPERAVPDEASTALFQRAIPLLHDDLVRNDHVSADAATIDWQDLGRFQVALDADLTVQVRGLGGPRSRKAVPVVAAMDLETRMLLVRDRMMVPRADAGGRALASVFTTSHRSVAQAWRAACDRAEADDVIEPLLLASERSKEEQARTSAEIEARTEAFRQETAQRQRKGGKALRPRPAPASPVDHQHTTSDGEPRRLVDPAALRIRDPEGTITKPSGHRRDTSSGESEGKAQLKEPKLGGARPKSGSRPPGYAPLSKETVGLDLVRMVLASDDKMVVDLRAQHNVGADAVDELRRFYELKVHGGSEPDTVSLTASEHERALTDPNFFLVVVSNVEVSDQPTAVRIIVDPLHQLKPSPHSGIMLSGVRDSHSIVYAFEEAEDV